MSENNENPTHVLLNYPFEKSNRYGAYICFFPQEIDGPTLSGQGSLFDIIKSIGKSMVSFASAKDYSDETITKLQNEVTPTAVKAGGGENKKIPELQKTEARTLFEEGMKIYLPTAFTTTDTLTYDSPSIGVTGASIEGGLNNVSGSVAEIFGKGVSNFMETFKTGGDPVLGKLGLARLSNKLGTANMGNGVASALRVTVDPNIRTLFRGVGIRNFQFQFKFLATSQQEAENVEEIIHRFREYAYPESIGLGGNLNISVGFKFPNPFQIYVKYRGKPTAVYKTNDKTGEKYIDKYVFPGSTRIGPKLKTCYLTNVTTNYNPTTMAFHADGKPVEIDLSLSFTEQTTLNRADIKAGY